MLFLEASYLPNFSRSEEDFLVQGSEHPAYELQAQTVSDCVYYTLGRVFQFLHSVEFSDLWWLVDSFHVDPDTFRVVGILRIIPIKEGNSLLHEPTLLPMPNKPRNLPKVHERDKIKMSVRLAFQDNSRRQALITHT